MKKIGKIRKGVCGVIIAKSGKILLGQRAHQPGQWQLPQGGIDKGETAIKALHREMEEEVGIKNIRILKQTKKFIPYRWPPDLHPNGRYAGQEHRYYLIDGSGVKIKDLTATEEFSAFMWHSPQKTIKLIVEWRRLAYERAFQELKLPTK